MELCVTYHDFLQGDKHTRCRHYGNGRVVRRTVEQLASKQVRRLVGILAKKKKRGSISLYVGSPSNAKFGNHIKSRRQESSYPELRFIPVLGESVDG